MNQPLFNMTLHCAAAITVGAFTLTTTASETVYSNLETPTFHGVGGGVQSLRIWDDLTIEGGGRVSEISFIAHNIGPDQRGISGDIEFRLFDNPNGGPIGTLLGTVPFDRSTILVDSFTDVSLSGLQSLGIDLPNDSRIAVGLKTAEGQWSQPAFNPPTIGSSDPVYWLGDNPVAPLSGGQAFVANLAWRIDVIPEPATGTMWAAFTSICILARRSRNR